MKALIQIDDKGRVTLPQWVCDALLKKAGYRGKSLEYRKRVVRREFMKLLSKAVIPLLLLPPTSQACSNKITITVAPGVASMNAFDFKQLVIAKTRCRIHFKNSPCLKWFIKYGDREYKAICGEGR